MSGILSTEGGGACMGGGFRVRSMCGGGKGASVAGEMATAADGTHPTVTAGGEM